ncbi:MAG TPA: hypothetical protein GXZ82_00135 [Firmicutes bacterium]|nr:hypothetical protein [Bacillota bacterium]
MRKTLGLFVCSLVTATALLLLSGTIWAADLPNSIALIADISPDGTLTHAQDYAAYGASQMLTQLGVPYRIEPTDTLTNLNLLSDYTIVIYPGHQLSGAAINTLTSYVEQGGVVVLGGSDSSQAALGVQVIGSGTSGVPQIAGRFTHQSEHPVLQGVTQRAMPILLPHGTSSYPVITAVGGAQGVGSAQLGTANGAALVIKNHGNGYFITFGTNPFASFGYGLGFATDPDEQHYLFPTHPGETHKVFNWETALAIKKEFVSEDAPNLFWGDEYAKLVQQTLVWAAKQQAKPFVWQWYWPELKDFAASIQHDWDGGKGPDAIEFREWEEARGVRSALYVLVPDRYPPAEAKLWYEGGWEIGLHVDKNPAPTDVAAKMIQDKAHMVANIGIPAEEIKGMCVHYLRFYKDSPLWWHEQGFLYDSTFYDMDWKQASFTGTLHPFYLKHGDKILSVLELPGRNEDGVMMANNGAYYLGTSNLNLAKERLKSYVDAVAAVHGHASWNGHPSHRHDALYGIEMQDLYVSYLRGENGYAPKNVWFVRPVDVAEWYIARAQMRIDQTWDGKTLTVTLQPAAGTSASLEGYTLLFSETLDSQRVKEIRVNGQMVEARSVSAAGEQFSAIIFDVAENCRVEVVYG